MNPTDELQPENEEAPDAVTEPIAPVAPIAPADPVAVVPAPMAVGGPYRVSEGAELDLAPAPMPAKRAWPVGGSCLWGSPADAWAGTPRDWVSRLFQ